MHIDGASAGSLLSETPCILYKYLIVQVYNSW